MDACGSALGDLLRGVAGLHAGNDHTARRIAQMLSVGGGGPVAPRAQGEAPRRPVTTHVVDDLRPWRSDTVTDTPPARATLPAALRLTLRRTLTRPPAPAWLDDVAAMPKATRSGTPGSVPPLWPVQRQRALWVALCARQVPGDQIDLRALTALLVSGQALRQIPRRPRRSLQGGVALLLDHRLGMAPYHADQLGMVALACSLMPDERVHVGRFDGLPGHAAAFDRVHWQGGARAPGRAVPTIVLSDLAIGGPPDEDAPAGLDWATWLALAHDERRVVRVLVPYAAARWPAACANHPALLEWSWALTLAGLRRHGGTA